MLVQKKYIPLIFLRGYRTAELRVNTRKDNIEMDIKEIALMTNSKLPLCTYTVLYRLLMFQLYNTCGTPLCLKSSDLSKKYVEGTRTTQITPHNKNTFLSSAHIHTCN